MFYTKWIDWKGTKCYNFFSLNERNKIKQLGLAGLSNGGMAVVMDVDVQGMNRVVFSQGSDILYYVCCTSFLSLREQML